MPCATDKAFNLPEDPDLEANFQALEQDFRNLIKARFSPEQAAPDKAFELPEDPDREANFQALRHDFCNLVKARFSPEQVRSNAAGFTFGKKIF